MMITQSFVDEADQKFHKVSTLHQEMLLEYRKTVKFFGENAMTMRIDDFFAVFAGFIKDFEVIL